jgi:hypothetical protein
MTVIRINAITVPETRGEELARRFAERAGAVDQADGFEGFELLRPTDDRQTWLVVGLPCFRPWPSWRVGTGAGAPSGFNPQRALVLRSRGGCASITCLTVLDSEGEDRR